MTWQRIGVLLLCLLFGAPAVGQEEREDDGKHVLKEVRLNEDLEVVLVDGRLESYDEERVFSYAKRARYAERAYGEAYDLFRFILEHSEGSLADDSLLYMAKCRFMQDRPEYVTLMEKIFFLFPKGSVVTEGTLFRLMLNAVDREEPREFETLLELYRVVLEHLPKEKGEAFHERLLSKTRTRVHLLVELGTDTLTLPRTDPRADRIAGGGPERERALADYATERIRNTLPDFQGTPDLLRRFFHEAADGTKYPLADYHKIPKYRGNLKRLKEIRDFILERMATKGTLVHGSVEVEANRIRILGVKGVKYPISLAEYYEKVLGETLKTRIDRVREEAVPRVVPDDEF